MRSRWRCHVKWAASEREEKNAWKKGRGQVVVWHHFIFWIIRNAMRITIETFLSWIHSFSTWKNPDDRTPLACALIINFYDSNLVLCHCWDFFCIFFVDVRQKNAVIKFLSHNRLETLVSIEETSADDVDISQCCKKDCEWLERCIILTNYGDTSKLNKKTPHLLSLLVFSMCDHNL